jgi:Rrf2 family nitric oxide-sensitive transcriptional repressor
MLSTTAEYAMRIMIVLTEAGNNPVTSETIAAQAKVPADYSVKVLQMLARANLVRAQRGRGGGFQLDCDPAVTSLLDIVNAIDPLERITTCPLDRTDHTNGLCPLHTRLDEVIVLLQESLRKMTLKSVIEGEEGPTLCAPPLADPAPVNVSVGQSAPPAGH